MKISSKVADTRRLRYFFSGKALSAIRVFDKVYKIYEQHIEPSYIKPKMISSAIHAPMSERKLD